MKDGYSDEQEIEVQEWTDDLGLNHEIREDDPARGDTLGERLRRELPDGPERDPRAGHRLTAPDEGLGPDEDDEEVGEDWGDEAGADLSAEERAIHIEPDR
ncbi:DUF5709 domain-containing protein [Nonomuraea typhae]|uniref:DUF5709 domain-containing protein n=1 Tax=Nonomuraea typhae TaxID=2603600 RepID=UPI0012FAB356|nr:DUF5709 domain-containing protein [Nonomuraea typhae]